MYNSTLIVNKVKLKLLIEKNETFKLKTNIKSIN